ncbi:hypothetical protein [Pedobacter cryotolerans]|uniref:Uncharacterized protein n=1 Tax=Pedobacter cryotolerans TaxID=2571270 RepID=A0A4U1C9W7_9SPHI|nr:hypothetical protein [Pedobacter cryotolerans]TKC01239.1 hypothetical protein FA045_08315 [Pedobacter cryotolerans]
MITETNKTIQQYAVEFEEDYQKIMGHNNNLKLSQTMGNINSFEIYTVYTDNTPVIASNSSVIVKL